jgi:hypothetical protein
MKLIDEKSQDVKTTKNFFYKEQFICHKTTLREVKSGLEG